jgi:5'-nucleotidase (lipoprotein e(P4) family)
MKKFKLPAVDSAHIILREDESSKIKRRNGILKNYEITLLIGDNLNDFSGDFELEDNNSRIEKVFELEEKFVDKFIILPNPMYGEWEKALLNGTYKHSKSERDSILISKLQSF